MLNNLIPMLLNSQNPMQLLMQNSNSSPELQKALQIMNNKSPEEFKNYVINACSTQNIDIESLIKKLNLPIRL